VLAVAFLLAALSSVKLTPAVLGENKREAPQTARDAVVVRPDQTAKPVRLRPGERVVGRGEPVGTIYRLADGRTIIVRKR